MMKHINPEKILLFWRNGPIPQWRQECTRRLLEMYPKAEVIADQDFGPATDYINDSFYYRKNNCKLYKNCLWADNDIWVNEQLPLTEKAAMVYEYGRAHVSLMWSGEHPEIFEELTNTLYHPTFKKFINEGIAEYIPLKYITHWSTDKDGNKTKRY